MPDAATTPPPKQRHRFPRKRSGPVKQYAEWLVVSTFVRLVEALPRRVSRGMLIGLAALTRVLARSRTRRTHENVVRALGVDDGRAAEIVAGSWRTLFLNAVEPVHLTQALARRPIEELVDIEGLDHVKPLLDGGQGVLLALAHFGAWECTAIAASRLLKPGWAVTRHLENERLSAWFVKRRGPVIAGTLDKDGDVRKLMRLLKQGEIVGPLLDQNAGHHGFLLDFLGQPCWQHRLPAVVAKRFGIPVVPLYGLHQADGRLRFVFEAPIVADPTLDGLEAELDVTRRLNASLEARVRAEPHEWLWLHDRWRRARKALQDGTARAGEPLADMQRAGDVRREVLAAKRAMLGGDEEA